jgi:uncharacterized membrane protein YbhN (UPF0104 family)
LALNVDLRTLRGVLRSSRTKRLATLGLRLIGVLLVVFVLSRIQFTDSVTGTDGVRQDGEILSHTGTSVVFLPEGGDSEITIDTAAESAPKVTAGVLTIVRGANRALLLIVVFIYGPITLISITRWWMLLRAIGMPIGYGEAFRLSYIGFFFNAVVPGLTGGDVVKAFYIARGSEEPYKAFISVFVDRAIGLFGLALLAAAVVSFHVHEPEFERVAWLVYAVLGAGSAAGCLVFSRRLRRWLGVERVLGMLPISGILDRIDQAITVYREAPRALVLAVVMSIANHVCITTMVVLIGRALGVDNPVAHFFAIVPLSFIVASVPLVPGGWGMREGAFAFFFAIVGVSPEVSVPMSVLVGLAQLVWFLAGGPIFIARPDRASSEEIREFTAEVEGTG